MCLGTALIVWLLTLTCQSSQQGCSHAQPSSPSFFRSVVAWHGGPKPRPLRPPKSSGSRNRPCTGGPRRPHRNAIWRTATAFTRALPQNGSFRIVSSHGSLAPERHTQRWRFWRIFPAGRPWRGVVPRTQGRGLRLTRRLAMPTTSRVGWTTIGPGSRVRATNRYTNRTACRAAPERCRAAIASAPGLLVPGFGHNGRNFPGPLE